MSSIVTSLNRMRRVSHAHVLSGDFVSAKISLRNTLLHFPDDYVTLTNLAWIAHKRGDDDEATDYIYRAAKHPDTANSIHFKYIKGLIDLKNGDWAKGWVGHEYRFAVGEVKQKAPYETLWDGGKCNTLVLWSEQGHGDQIQMVRFAKQAKEQSGAYTILVVDKSLVPLFDGMADAVLSEYDLEPNDRHCPLMSLPGMLGVTKENVDGAPYCGRVHKEARREIGKGLVGICWRGEQSNPELRDRSIHPATLEPIKQACPAWTSLQYGEGFFPKDWKETAEAVAKCGLVITIDTGVAHMAGAMGVPTWLMLRYQGDWRWMRGIDYSPWYDSFKIYRQPSMGDWKSVVQKITSDLKETTYV